MALDLGMGDDSAGGSILPLDLGRNTAPRVIRLTVPVEPVAKGRPRFVRATGRAYTPPKTALGEWQIRQAFLNLLDQPEPLRGPLKVTIEAIVRMPQSVPKRDRERARPVSRPDLDQYVKSALDGLQALAFYDDSQVVDLMARKVFGEPPRWEIMVEEVR